MSGFSPRDAAAPHRASAAALAAFAGLNLLNYLDRYVLYAVVSPLERELRLNDRQFGLVATAFMAGYFLTSPFFGYLGDRLPRKPLIAVGIAVWSAGTVCTGLASGLISLFLFRVVVGFGEASFGTISPAWIADLFPPARRNLAISLFYMAIPVGSALGFIAGGALAVHYGWRAAFYIAGGPGLVLAAVVLALPEPVRGASEPAPVGGPPGGAPGGFFALARIPAYRLVVAGYVALTFALGGFGTWAAAFLERAHHMSYAAADRFFGVSLAATGLTATLAGGWLGSAWQRRTGAGYSRVLALSTLAAAPVALAALTVRDLAWAKAALAASMFLLFLPTGPTNTLILETVPVALRARAMAVSIFAIHLLGDLWSPQIVGLLSDEWGDLRRAVIVTLPVAIAVAAGFWTWLAIRDRPAGTRPA